MYLQRNTVHSNIRKASGFVITTEPLGFVLTKQVNDLLLRVYLWCHSEGKLNQMYHRSLESSLYISGHKFLNIASTEVIQIKG